MITIERVTKSFGSTVAVDGVSLSIRKGELFGLLGPNGAGKSTLINVVVGLLTPDGGTVGFDGPNGARTPRGIRPYLGLVPQDLAFYPNYNAAENVRFFASLYGIKGRALGESVDAALEFAGLTDSGKKPAKSFSGGMKRRLNIACGIAHNPQIIVLDEPTVGIDPQSRNHILRAVEGLIKQGKTVVYTTHYMEEAEAICSRIAIMDKGKVIAQGTRDELKLLIKNSARVVFSFCRPETVDTEAFGRIPGVIGVEAEELELAVTSEVGIANLNRLTAEVNRQNLAIVNIRSDSPSLETVFLNLTGRSLRD